ncbi:Silent information regulator protein Sir2 [Fibrella aestuarina BUZ 2]|uniref:NAD-dependent protein deacylase n=1 Tax=Fibrella aestuarina BUZ 2 TaxID=1166018 RepID=I0KEE3_9BACT|nr:NAD-dependent deacylase [Fibrella aestuarina]CCH02496.1 Silent information regulator protein Sir2 [Fibrella aestuarina BUZ 2]
MKTRKKIVVLSGAGISAESGIATFRDSNGLWENHRIEDVATPEAWRRNRELVLDFYNQRRKQALTVEPNAGHQALVRLEEAYDVTIITQNVDGLHEKAGSSHVLHLHGELSKARSSVDESLIYEIDGWEIKLGDTCEKGSQLRPHIVWFGEAVPTMEEAVDIAITADMFIVVGTSLVVYPAAGLVDFIPDTVPIYVVDPNLPEVRRRPNLTLIGEPASTGLTKLADQLLAEAQ